MASTSSGAADAAALVALEAKIAEHCDSVTWVTTGIFTLSIFLSILRPDPTLTICLFGFYGASVHQRSTIAHIRGPPSTPLTKCTCGATVQAHTSARPARFAPFGSSC